MSQKKVRRCDRNLNKFVESVRQRRKKYGLGADFRLLLDLTQQARLENWIDFQDYHLRRLEKLEQERDKFKEELKDTQKKVEESDTADSERAKKDIHAVQQDIRFFEDKLKWHKVLLQWIEQQRTKMQVGDSRFLQEDHDEQHAEVVQKISTYNRPKSRAKGAPVVLGNVRVSKTNLRERQEVDFEPQSSRIQVCHPGLGRHTAEQHSIGAEASRDKTTTYQGRDATPPTSSAEGLEDKMPRWSPCELTVRESTPCRGAEPIFGSSAS